MKETKLNLFQTSGNWILSRRLWEETIKQRTKQEIPGLFLDFETMNNDVEVLCKEIVTVYNFVLLYPSIESNGIFQKVKNFDCLTMVK